MFPATSTISSSVAVNQELLNSAVVASQNTVIKIIRYMSIKLTSLLEILQINASKGNNLRKTYPTCINSFGAVLKKLLGILNYPIYLVLLLNIR